MNPKTRKILIFLALPAALVWGVMNLSEDQQKQPEDSVSSQETIDPDAQVVALEQTPPRRTLTNIEEMSSLPWGTDPFRAVRSKQVHRASVTSSIGWSLKGIVHNNNNPMAYINSQAVYVGDTVNNAAVHVIEKRAVILKYKDRHIKLQVDKG